MIEKDELIKSFRDLGVKKGDTVFIRGGLGKIGRLKPRNLFLDSLLEMVGSEGTVVTLGFTKSFPFYRVDKNYVFSEDTKATTGALAKQFMEKKECLRSSHPMNSFLAIGKNASYILKEHNENTLSYAPMEKLIKLNAKMIIFSIIVDSPGFTTVHYAQEKLGLTKKSLFKGLFRVYYRKGNEVKLFKRNDIGGCSHGFSKFYKHYIDENLLRITKIGNSQAMSIEAKAAYDIEYKLMNENNSYHFCDDPYCISCRASWKYDLKYLPTFLIVTFLKKIKGLIK